MALPQDAVLRALNAYCFETTWNAPADECGVNLQLFPVSNRFVANNIITGRSVLALPVAGQQYAAFWMNHALFSDSLVIAPDTWVATDQLAVEHQTLFHVYAGNGLMLPKASVFVYHSTKVRRVYIAVQKTPVVQIVGLSDWPQLYISVRRYPSSSGRPLTVTSGRVPSPDPIQAGAAALLNAIAQARTSFPNGTFVYVNGYDHPADGTIMLSPGDYVDIYTDATVFGKYTVNLATATSGYFSSLYAMYKEILHCPKAINPTNLILTTEMLTLTARRNSDNVGAFMHRNMKDGLTQITHNDVGIATDVVDAYRASLGTSDISIEVRLRSHDNYLIRDASYITYLYVCNDATILRFLSGEGDPSLPFWTAAALEQTGYVTDMTRTPSLLTPQTLGDYVGSLGYYTAMSAICQHDNLFVIDSLPVNAISVQKPLILASKEAYPIVYLEGTKLRDTQVDYANTYRGKVVFSLTPDVYAQTGQRLTVELIESGTSIPYLFTPAVGSATVTVPYEGVTVFQVNPISDPVIGYQVSAETSYIPITPGLGQPVQTAASSDGGTTLTFQPASLGHTYVIQNAAFSRCYGVDISDQVASLTPVHIELTTLCSDTTTAVPLLGYQTLAVYLNGRRMVEDIDYFARPLKDSAGNPAIIQVLLCNRSALASSGQNYLEVIAHTATELSREFGYVNNGLINVKNNAETWYSELTTTFANGQLLINPTDEGDALRPQETIGNGVPFFLSSAVPSSAAAALTGMTSTADDQRIVLINRYLNQLPPVNDISMLIIPKSWQVYSPYLTAIIHDATQSGQIQLYSNDPDPTMFLKQFAAYDYLLAMDPTLNPTNQAIDLRYCDIYPVYKTVSVPDLNTYTVMQRLAGLLLPADSDTLGDVTNA